MRFLKKLFRRGEDEVEDAPVTVDVARRRPQLLRLEQAADALANDMRSHQSMDNPGWRGRVNEYSNIAGAAMQLRRGEMTREAVLDLVFEARPVFSGEIPAGLESIAPLQDELMAAANDLRELLPGERP